MDFEYQDFAIVEAPQADVVKAIARMALADDLPTDDLEPVVAFGPKGSDAAATVAEMFPDAPRSLLGVLWRLFAPRWLPLGRKRGDAPGAPEAGESEQAPRLVAHCDAAAELERPITWGRESEFGEERRVSAIAGSPGLTLVEFADIVQGMSITASGLSSALDDHPVYYFRRSGRLADDPQHDFHIYRGFVPERRVYASRTTPTDGSPPSWEGGAEGPMSPFEDSALYAGADETNAMSPERQRAILTRMGVDLGRLFAPGGRETAVLINRRDGGAPIEALL